MLREKFWFTSHEIRHKPLILGLSLSKKKPLSSKFPTDFYKQAVRDKHDRTDNACTVSTSRCSIQSLRKLKGFVWDNGRYLQYTHYPSCHFTFSCKEDSYKLKLYDEGAALPLDRTVQILSLKEATKRELQELKTAEIESIAKRGIAPNGENTVQKGNKADPEKRPFQSSDKNCGYCNRQHTTGRRNCPAATTRCIKCNKTGHFPEICRRSPVNLVGQV